MLGTRCRAPAQVEGKAAARETLRYRLGLTGWGDKPLVGVVTRLTAQKGALASPLPLSSVVVKCHLSCARSLSVGVHARGP